MANINTLYKELNVLIKKANDSIRLSTYGRTLSSRWYGYIGEIQNFITVTQNANPNEFANDVNKLYQKKDEHEKTFAKTRVDYKDDFLQDNCNFSEVEYKQLGEIEAIDDINRKIKEHLEKGGTF